MLRLAALGMGLGLRLGGCFVSLSSRPNRASKFGVGERVVLRRTVEAPDEFNDYLKNINLSIY